MTVSHLRFGPQPIRSTYLVTKANFVACHQPVFLERYDMVKNLVSGGTFLLNTPFTKEQVWDKLPRVIQEGLITKKAKLFVIDATKVAKETGMGGRINTIMQVCFFALSGVLPRNEAIEAINIPLRRRTAKKAKKWSARILPPSTARWPTSMKSLCRPRLQGTVELAPGVVCSAPKNVQFLMGKIAAGLGDELPVSAFPCDGTFPTATHSMKAQPGVGNSGVG